MREIPRTTGLFQQQLKQGLQEFLSKQYSKFPANEILQIDLHCHDLNSDVPDELFGRILGVPETWIKSDILIRELKRNDCDVFTITNHNNARSCFELQEKGVEVLTGAEFSCFVPDFNVGIHVLAYGFSKAQETELNKLRKNVYHFQEYACKENIPTIWAHPLYHYSSSGVPSIDFFSKLALIFERFEVVNGQRDTWQNMLVKEWLDTLTPELIAYNAVKYNIDPSTYCKDPYRKVYTGGSDSHIGLFAGLTGSYLHVPELEKKLITHSKSDLALESLREGRIVPYGSHNNSEKLTIALLDYVFQIALFRKDPGLLRILFHRGTLQDKMIALIVSNGFAEIQFHKTTMEFTRLFHHCLMGKVPSFRKKWMIPKTYKSIFRDAIEMAETNRDTRPDIVQVYSKSVSQINHKLNGILFARMLKKLEKLNNEGRFNAIKFNTILENFEIPSDFSTYLMPTKKSKRKQISNPEIREFLDGLSFPFLASSLILAANFASSKVLYNNRPLLSEFARITGKYSHPKRMLWLSDTFADNYGVSTVLKSFLREIQQRNLPVDLLVCSNAVVPEDHLIVIRPELEFTLPFYKEQPLRIPNFLSIHEIFQQGEYDRVMCSTEGAMGLAAIYLKNAFSVKAHFYIHTDWVIFARKVLGVDGHNLNRFRRLLRVFYQGFDSLFVLNTEQQKWLSGTSMGFKPENVHLTAHWVDHGFMPKPAAKETVFGFSSDSFVILYSGRLSHEKGVMELPEIYNYLNSTFPEVKIVVAGTGPAESELKNQFPQATFLGWVDHEHLPWIYSASDILILPSKFDTFSCSVLEAISCGLPVIAYKIKGPKDIINDAENGFLVNTIEDMKRTLYEYIINKEIRMNFKHNALLRAQEYNKDLIINKMLNDLELNITQDE